MHYCTTMHLPATITMQAIAQESIDLSWIDILF